MITQRARRRQDGLDKYSMAAMLKGSRVLVGGNNIY
jgi:hypothetical protein